MGVCKWVAPPNHPDQELVDERAHYEDRYGYYGAPALGSRLRLARMSVLSPLMPPAIGRTDNVCRPEMWTDNHRKEGTTMDPRLPGAASPRGLRDDTIAAEEDRFGGMKFGSAFFGWMTAAGISVLLTALITGAAAAVGAANNLDPSAVMDQAAQNLQEVSIAGGIIFAVVLFISYYCGGYVAGRMARFDGAKQGFAVWLWAVIAPVIAALLAALAGNQFNNLLNATTFPGMTVNEGTLTAGGITALAIAALVALAGAVLGGKMGMRFHRRVDETATTHHG